MPGATTLFLRTMTARAYPRVIGLTREWSWLFFEVFLPFIATCSYAMVYHALGAPRDFVGFVVLGGALSAFWLNVMWNLSSQLHWEKQQGNLGIWIASPAPLMGILMGMAVGGAASTALRASVVLITGTLIFGIRYDLTQLGAAVGMFLVTLAGLYCLGMLLSSAFLLFGREAWHTSNLVQEPVSLISGFYFPVKALPAWVAGVATVIPMTLGLDAMRQLLLPEMRPHAFLPVRTEALALTALAVAFFLGARFALRHLERLARAEGRLTERGR